MPDPTKRKALALADQEIAEGVVYVATDHPWRSRIGEPSGSSGLVRTRSSLAFADRRISSAVAPQWNTIIPGVRGSDPVQGRPIIPSARGSEFGPATISTYRFDHPWCSRIGPLSTTPGGPVDPIIPGVRGPE